MMSVFTKEMGLSVGCGTVLGAVVGVVARLSGGNDKPDKMIKNKKLSPVS